MREKGLHPALRKTIEPEDSKPFISKQKLLPAIKWFGASEAVQRLHPGSAGAPRQGFSIYINYWTASEAQTRLN
jgi:hypothetical protein